MTTLPHGIVPASKYVSFVSREQHLDTFSQLSFVTVQFFEEQGQRHGLIGCGRQEIPRTDEGIWSPYAKFEVEVAEYQTSSIIGGATGNAVHIKSCYNQKYLRRASQDPSILDIAAAADEPEEDTTKWNCTLFFLEPITPTTRLFLKMVRNNSLQIVVVQLDSSSNLLWLRNINSGRFIDFEIVELDMLPILPTHVCFKADNDRYLRVVQTTSAGNQVIRAMFTGTDRREREALFRVIPTRDRTVVLRPVAFPDTYLVQADRLSYFVASSNRNDFRRAPLEPVMLNFAGPPAVAFKTVSRQTNDRFFIVRMSDNSFGIPPNQTGIVAEAEFLIEDTVRSRQLSNILFLYDDMKILEPNPVAVLTKNVINGSTVSTQEAHLSFRYSEYQSSHWETTHSWQVGISAGTTTTISARLPVLKFIRAEATVSVEVEAGYQGEHVAGETKVEESEMSTSFTVKVPPRTQSLVNMVVSRAKVQLPFTYTQREVLHDGGLVSSKKVDGLYEGEATHVDYQVEEANL